MVGDCYLVDTFGIGAKHLSPIPFDFIAANPICLSEEKEFDYGIIPLSKHYVNLLKANNIQSLNEEVWKKQPTHVDFYMLLGVPSELTKLKTNNIEFTTTLHRIDLLEQKPAEFPDTNYPLFYGRIIINESITNIEGMSGGPILGFYKNEKNELRYWLIALQSTWLESSKLIKACPTHILGNYLEEEFKVNK